MFVPMKPRATTPEFIKDIEKSDAWALSEKFRGWQLRLHLSNNGNRLLSAGDTNVIRNVPQFAEIIPSLHSTILVVEGMAPDCQQETANSIFSSEVPYKVINWQKTHGLAWLAIHDCVKFCGENVHFLSLLERREYLAKAYRILKRRKWPVLIEKLVMKNKYKAYLRILDSGGEGVMIKNVYQPYEIGEKPNHYLKVKPKDPADYIIMGFTKSTSNGRYKGMVGSVIYGYLDIITNQMKIMGSAGGLDNIERLTMTRRPQDFIGRVASFSFIGKTKYGKLKHPNFIGMRPDKLPEEVTKEGVAQPLIKQWEF